ncbi:MAG: WYL domain-containing protein, partial [Lachnospiraceae bacterium]|nr:WYL domain-containing protein [Lachnospiraceae bacterium]
MARGTNQKLKLLYLMKILLEKTDDAHSLTLAEILDELSMYDITAERKSIYTDFEALRLYGMDIISEQRGRKVYYHVG